MKIKDMPKLECPFVREVNSKGEYVVIDKINPGYEWVFNDKDVLAIEKLHGTNVSIIIEGGNITSIFNRTERIPFINKSKKHIVEGILNSWERGYCDLLEDGQIFGELVGPRVNGNPYKLDVHLWIPFSTFCQNHLRYKSWGKYPKDFDTISEWFKDLLPLYWNMIHGKDEFKGTALEGQKGFVEGIVFTHPDGRMAKLRRDQFDWFIGARHKEIENV
jgi:hypothetical protein